MTKFNRCDCFTYAGAAEVLGVAVWRLRYAVDSGYLPRPSVRFKRRAMFGPGQLEWMRAYFAHEGIDSDPKGCQLHRTLTIENLE